MVKEILKILKAVDRINTQDILGSYSTRYIWRRYFEREARGRGWIPAKELSQKQKKAELQKFYSTLHILKKQGFIQKMDGKFKKSFWKLTKKGFEKLVKIHAVKKNMPEVLKSAKIVKDSLKIVAFDIPESLRHYRHWLRATLVNHDFRMLQKSVWLGDAKLPEDLILKFKQYNLTKYIHIFSVRDTGTLV